MKIGDILGSKITDQVSWAIKPVDEVKSVKPVKSKWKDLENKRWISIIF